MSYLVELVIKFPIDWHLNLKIFIFDQFSQKKDDTKNAKIRQKIKFPKSDRDG